jgi:PKD repeat protein
MKNLLLLFAAIFIGTGASAQCVASFTATQNPSRNVLLNVDFTDNSTYGMLSSSQMRVFNISYGDGSSNAGSLVYTSALPSHIYTAPGTYTVGLTISKFDTSTKSVVCSNFTSMSVTVAYPACGTIVSSSGTGATQTFSATNPAGSSGISYSWNFGDGTTGTGASVSHTYSQYGQYSVSCASTTGSPATCYYTNYLTVVVAPPVSPASLICSLTQASFTATVGGGGTYANCINTSTFIPYVPTSTNPYLARSKWDFGDGTVSYDTHPFIHYYPAAGTYTITLDMKWEDSNKSVTPCLKTVTKTVTITSVANATIEGEVGWDSATYKGILYNSFKVWLIQFDPITNLLTALDSQLTSAKTPHGYTVAGFSFANKAPGNYLLKAALVGGPSSGAGIVPTYCQYSSLWSSAKTIAVTNGSNPYEMIYMNNGTVTAGPGFVGGNVSLGANKGANAGVAGLPVYLLNGANKQMVRMTTTDANGNFSFSNFPIGAYMIYPELLNYATTPVTLNITAANANIIGKDFHQDDVKMSIMPLTTAVRGAAALRNKWVVFPNPAKNEATVSWEGTLDRGSAIVVSDVTGKLMMQVGVEGLQQGKKLISLRTLSPGLYLVHGTGSLAGVAQKLSVE